MRHDESTTRHTFVFPGALDPRYKRRYARLWNAIVRGKVPPRTEEVERWYALAKHGLSLCLHEVHLAKVLADGSQSAMRPTRLRRAS